MNKMKMTLKEKLKLFLDEDLIEKEEYSKLMTLAEDEVPKEEQPKEVPKEEVKETKDGDVKPAVEEPKKVEETGQHPEIKDDEETKEETADDIKVEAKTETPEEEAKETPEEQSTEEDVLLKRIEVLEGQVKDYQAQQGQYEEIKKTNEALGGRLSVVEELLNKLSVKEDVDKDFGASGTGKAANGGEPMVDGAKGLWDALNGHK